ncbi:hypothetical protein D1872_225030 [compost metagenome]
MNQELIRELLIKISEAIALEIQNAIKLENDPKVCLGLKKAKKIVDDFYQRK